MALPSYDRPTFPSLGLVRPTCTGRLKEHLIGQVERYNEFLNDSVLVAQRTWLLNTRVRGYDVESAAMFATYPCMNHSTSSDRLEQIETTMERGRRVMSQLLFIYMPEDNAMLCQATHSLDGIPNDMRFTDFAGRKSVLAVDIPPYSTYTSKEAIMERYHSVGCGAVEEDDIECCVVIAKTDRTVYDNRKDLYARGGFGSFDVISVAPVLFRRTLPEFEH